MTTQAILNKMHLYRTKHDFLRPYLDYISPIFLSHKGPRNYKGYPKVQYDIYKVHCRGLYGQPRLYQAKITNLGPFRPNLDYLCPI